MMLTREQAAEVWCPMVRLTRATDSGSIVNGQTVFNRVELGASPKPAWPSVSSCIADKCAMWRWVQGGQKNSAGDRHPTTRGYCGLAGAPVIGGAS